ncbi:hypothetical protein CVT24_009125 [Panaeolus cyanescens]|uniref:Uncharacterized protein n=1 Tax=Panaeolus cyanescens TaxID=181874 RepID=A0A409VAM6_9AGAR|nr:hypothetical protein CVT24_009125 [Panaeolus cyanescens]
MSIETERHFSIASALSNGSATKHAPIQVAKEAPSLTSLTEWSRVHIKSVFAAPTHEDAMRGVQETFAAKVYDSINGVERTNEQLQMMVAGVRKYAAGPLEVQWLNTVEMPTENGYKSGGFGAYYIIRGLEKVDPRDNKLKPYIRHKSVTVRIESQPHLSDDPNVDTRRIVTLGLVATDLPAEDFQY